MALLVTGGSGFVGSHLLRQVSQFTDSPVYVMDVRQLPETDNIRWVFGDITLLPHLIEAIRKYKVKRIIHLASLRNLGSQRDPQGAFRLNCVGSVNVLEAARLTDVERVVFASTVAVYGPRSYYQQLGNPDPILDEMSPARPSNLYGISKLFLEQWAQQYHALYNLDTIGVRLGIIFGPGKTAGSLTSEFNDVIEAPLHRRPVTISRYGDEAVNLQYVKDAARALLTAAFTDRPHGRLYNSGGWNVTTAELVETVRSLDPSVQIELVDDAKRRAVCSKVDVTRILEDLNFAPAGDLRSAIQDHLAELERG